MSLVAYQPGDTIDFAHKAWSTAQQIARTDFVPVALRGKPEAVLAAMLTGHELGIGPMQALSKIHVIEGRPTMSAELMRALVLSAGHDLAIEESTVTKCTVVGRRHNSERDTRITWTLDDAKRAGLDGKQNWRRYPREMLLARATAALCRAVFSDVLAGISYSLEELTDGDVINVEDRDAAPPAANGAAAAKRTARARRAATAQPSGVPGSDHRDSSPEARPSPGLPPLPGEEDEASDGIDDAELVDEPAEYEGEDQDLGATPRSRAQFVAMRCNDAGLDDDGRHRFLHAFSAGAYSSATDVPADHERDLFAALVKHKRGDLLIQDVPPMLIDTLTRLQVGPRDAAQADRPAAAAPPQAAPATDRARPQGRSAWLQRIKDVPGVGGVTLANRAKELADELGVDKPATLDDLTDPRLVDAVLDWLETQT